MATSTALPETLKAVTATKIKELSKQRNNHETAKKQVLEYAEQQTSLVSKVRSILDGACGIQGFPITSDDVAEIEEHALPDNLRNKKRFLYQAEADPSFSPSILRQLGEDVSQELELKSRGHAHAEFFSRLATQWLSDYDCSEPGDVEASSEGVDGFSAFEDVGRKEMHQQRAEWESLVFNRTETDSAAIHEYLTKLFTSNKANTKALDELRKNIRSFGASFETGSYRFDCDFLKLTIQGLTVTDLLSRAKNAILKTISNNQEVLSEICDVLNMRQLALSTWSWSTDESRAIPLEMRRKLNGKYRVFMDEDVLDALMLHGIGLRWAVRFKHVFTTFFSSRAWHRSDGWISQADRERREYFLGEESSRSRRSNVHAKRRNAYAENYFMTQLPQDISEGARAYDEDHEQQKSGPLETKHSLLHLLITESLLSAKLGRDFTVIRSDFKWFGPSLPHSTIFAVLRFFGLSETWINFFTCFLEAPLRFIQDGPKGAIRTRKTGVPMSHTLSTVFGEALLFCMDYAVNQKTPGSFLYRLHDDFWFWGEDTVSRKAWKAMTEFAEVMGIRFNKEKTGAVRLGSSDAAAKEKPEYHEPYANILPKGEVRWGLLRLDPQIGCFMIDQTQVDEHIKELKLQLSHCNSIFSWIQAYNAYLARFVSNNLGKPSVAFGRNHVDMMIQTFARIQRALFPNGSVTDHLRQVVEDEFAVKDLPDAFFYWPIRMGGLELRNPLIPLFGMRDSLRTSPDRLLEQALDRDEETFQAAKERFGNKGTKAGLGRRNNFELARNVKAEGDAFMSMEEYLRYREETSGNLATAYTKLLTVPAEKEVAMTPQIASWLEGLESTAPVRATDKGSGKRPMVTGILADSSSAARGSTGLESGICKDWLSMQPYWKWTLAVHGAEVVDRYGSVRMVDEARVPVGVVGVMKQGRVQWRG